MSNEANQSDTVRRKKFRESARAAHADAPLAANTQRPMREQWNFMLDKQRFAGKKGMPYLDDARIAQSRTATGPSKIRRAKIGSHRQATGGRRTMRPARRPDDPRVEMRDESAD